MVALGKCLLQHKQGVDGWVQVPAAAEVRMVGG